MSRIVRHSNYTEITNGLFMEIADKEFIFGVQDGVLKRIQDVSIQDIEEALHIVFEERPMVFETSREGYSDFSRALLEESRRLSAQSRPTRFYNMSEEEIINYFDTLS